MLQFLCGGGVIIYEMGKAEREEPVWFGVYVWERKRSKVADAVIC
jgi:hypothetical protein